MLQENCSRFSCFVKCEWVQSMDFLKLRWAVNITELTAVEICELFCYRKYAFYHYNIDTVLL